MAAGEKKLLGQLLEPLLAQIGGRDDQDATFVFRPALGDDEAGFDGLAESARGQ
jgi:hypothetical protein